MVFCGYQGHCVVLPVSYLKDGSDWGREPNHHLLGRLFGRVGHGLSPSPLTTLVLRMYDL